MKKVLLTNFNMVNYSGSEIDTMTIANYFFKMGYEVHIFTLKKGKPLMDMINDKIKIITPNEKDLLSSSYEIIWSHHYPLLDYILFSQKIKSKYIIYMSLSAFEAYESLPDYCNDLSLIGAISNEVSSKLVEEGCKENKIYLFPNYATNEFFDAKIKQHKKIKKICIVSNHVPEELAELKQLAENKEIEVDIFGIQFTPKYIDEKVLKDYDVVISIGKTVYYSLSMGIPVYCYDYFGGYGYITNDNIEEAYKYNFSGRGFGQKKTSDEILDEIINNYEIVTNNQERLKKFAYKNFSFENNMKKLLKEMKKHGIMDFEKITKLYPYYQRKGRLFVEKASIYENQINSCRQIEKYEREEFEKNKKLVESLMHSTSWKITKPLRKMKEIIFKCLKGRAK